MSRILFRAAIPPNEMKPTRLAMEMSCPVMRIAAAPPRNATGMFESVYSVRFSDLKCHINSPPMTAMESSESQVTTRAALTCASNWPLIRIA